MKTFSEDEARAVFARAARAQQAATDGDGDRLTLDELREIGLASGLDPAFVAAAARDVALGAPDVAVRTVGPVPTAVLRSVRLAEAPTDALWERLVADARRTFGAQGQVSGRGDAREWRNGNLRMSLAADGDGARLSVQTNRERQVRTRLVLGGVQLATALVIALMASQTGDASSWGLAVLLAVIGAVLTAGTWAQQRLWAAAREAQMEDLAERAAAGTASAGPAVATAVAPPTTEAPLRGAFDAFDEPDAPAGPSADGRVGRTRA
ncbi:MAG TPA: hypothetical protein VGB53_08695 [Rubricoccaceae bacterium]|jgi:hypothetical protein